MLNLLLAEDGANNGWVIYVFLGVIVVLFILMFFFTGRKRKKQEQDAQNLINAVGPGNKVKTIGGVCGIVVEVDNEENTFILETGSETTGKCYIKFDKQAIYQTDAVVPDSTPAAAEATEEQPSSEQSQDAEANANTDAEPAKDGGAEEGKEAEKQAPAEAETEKSDK